MCVCAYLHINTHTRPRSASVGVSSRALRLPITERSFSRDSITGKSTESKVKGWRRWDGSGERRELLAFFSQSLLPFSKLQSLATLSLVFLKTPEGIFCVCAFLGIFNICYIGKDLHTHLQYSSVSLSVYMNKQWILLFLVLFVLKYT